MKKGIVLTAVIGMACAAFAQLSSSKLVEITDMGGFKGYEIMDATAFADLQKQIREETTAYPAALAEAKKQWAENKDNKGTFQATAVKVRKFRILAQGAEEALNKKKEKMEERLSDEQAKDAEKTESKYKAIRDETARSKAQEKDEAKAQSISQAITSVSKIMAEKLGRAIPTYGQNLAEAASAFGADKKTEKKAAGADKEKKEDTKAAAKEKKATK